MLNPGPLLMVARVSNQYSQHQLGQNKLTVHLSQTGHEPFAEIICRKWRSSKVRNYQLFKMLSKLSSADHSLSPLKLFHGRRRHRDNLKVEE